YIPATCGTVGLRLRLGTACGPKLSVDTLNCRHFNVSARREGLHCRHFNRSSPVDACRQGSRRPERRRRASGAGVALAPSLMAEREPLSRRVGTRGRPTTSRALRCESRVCKGGGAFDDPCASLPRTTQSPTRSPGRCAHRAPRQKVQPWNSNNPYAPPRSTS